MNESCLVESHRTIDIDKLSTQFTCNFLRDSVIFKDTKNKNFEEICLEKVLQLMKPLNYATTNNNSLIDENFSDERNTIFIRLKKLSKTLRLSYQTLHLVFYYIDTIIAKCGKFVNITLENIALGCLSLAIKFYEFDENENLPVLDGLGKLFYENNDKINIKDYKNFELFCLDKLEYKLNMVTPWTVVELMIGYGIFFNDEQKSSLYSKNEKNYGDPVYKLAKEIIEYTLEDYSYFNYSSLQLACSCIALIREIMEAETLWNESLEIAYKIKLEEFITCFDYVKKKYFKVKHSKKGRDSSIGRKIKRVITEPEVSSNSSPEIQIVKEPIKKQSNLSHKDSIESFKLKSSEKAKNYIKIVKRSQIPQGNNSNGNLNKIISPFAKNKNVKTVTLTNKNLIPIAKEYSFRTKNVNPQGIPIQTAPNLNITHHNLTTNHSVNNNPNNYNKVPKKSSRLNILTNNTTLDKDLLHKNLKALQLRESKLNDYTMNTSKILRRTFSHDRYQKFDAKYMENFYNTLRVYSVEKCSVDRKHSDRISLNEEKNLENMKNKCVFQSNRNGFSFKATQPDNNLKTNATIISNRNSINGNNISNIKLPISTKPSRKNILISVPSSKNLNVNNNITENKQKTQTLSKLPSQKVMRTFNRKITQIFNGRESFGTKNENTTKK